jgi:5-methylcytosine-specific restriction protein A
METRSLAFVADDEVLRRLAAILHQSRRVEAEVIEHVAEVDARRLYLREGSASMFAYCTATLHLSEAEAYARITVARASRRYPMLLPRLREGRLQLTGIALLSPHLTAENAESLLARAEHKTKRQIEELVAEIAPRPDAPSFIRRLAEHPGAQPLQPRLPVAEGLEASVARSGSGDVAGFDAGQPQRLEAIKNGATESCGRLEENEPLQQAVQAPPRQHPRAARPIEALAPGRYRVQFTASSELREKLERLRALLRPQVSDGDLATVIERAVSEAIDRLEAHRFGKTEHPRAAPRAGEARASRHIPASVRRVVAERNGLQCGFVGRSGRRCAERCDLEYHDRRPWAMGGSHDAANIGLLCRSHNAWLAEQDFGPRSSGRREKSHAIEAGSSSA